MAATNDSEPLYIGVDVGTGSVRTALVEHSGSVLASATADTRTFRDDDDHRIFEQSTSNIWACICHCVHQIIESVDISRILGIGFDATCSLAVTDLQGNPITVSRSADIGKPGERNIILWADHRAEEETALINSSDSVVLDYVGGTMSVRR